MNVTRISAPPGSTQIMISRRFAARRDLVFRAYVEPDLLVRWWGQEEHVTRIDWYEPRDGGRWRIVSTDAEGREHGFRGVFHGTPEPVAGIVQTFEYDGAPGHVSLDTYTFVDHGTETTVESLSVFQTEADRDRIAGSMEPGVRESARRLARLLSELAEGAV